jgi:hypothetical protein
MRAMQRVLVCLSVLGCGGTKPDAPADLPAAPRAPDATKPELRGVPAVDKQAPVPAKSGVQLTVDGKPAAIQSALAVGAADGSIELTLATTAYTCKDALAGTPATGFEVRLRVNHRLAKDGTLGWGLRSTSFDGVTAEKPTGTDPLPGASIDPAAGAVSKVALDFTRKGPGGKSVVVAGTAEFTGCGAAAPKPPEPQKDAVMTIAGKPFPIAGAAYILTLDGERVLMFSTSPVHCVETTQYPATPGADLAVVFRWNPQGELAIGLDGTWLEDAPMTYTDVKLTASPNRAPGGGKPMAVKLDGTATVAGYSVALKGTVNTIVCPTQK